MMDKLKQSMVASDRTESRWLTTTSLVILAGVALAFALAYTRPVMIPFVLALFIVIMVSPVMDFLMLVLRFPRVLAVTITLVVVILIVSLVGLLVADVVRKVVHEAGSYSDVLETLILDTYDKSVELREWLQGVEVSEPNEVPKPN
ncbi:MAG: AI-2E family transporter [Planctomycetes bacterium]|nr:AI-2E family transporter [Planctomycetota bacterium]